MSTFRSTPALFDQIDVVVIARLDRSGVTPGRRLYSGTLPPPEDELLFSTFYMRLDVVNVLIDHRAYPVGDEIIVETRSPTEMTIEEIRAAMPSGNNRRIALALADSSGTGDPAATEEVGSLPEGERPYGPYLQGIVIEDDDGGVVSVFDGSVFANPRLVDVSFDALVTALGNVA